MGSIFGTYSTAVSGMRINQIGLSVASHNAANVNTTGYSRQRMVSEDNYYNQQSGFSLGTGTNVEKIQRLRNQFLDRTYQQQNAKTGYWEAKSSNLEDVELILNEFTSDNGLQQTLQEFFNSWQELAKDPSSLSSRQTVLEYGELLVEAFTQSDQQLQQLQQDLNTSVINAVNSINDISAQIAALNSQIVKTEVSGVEAADLRDQRDSLLDELSSLVNINVAERDSGAVEVSIGGVSLVNGSKTHTLAAVGDGSTQNPLKVQWAQLEVEANITGGKVKAYLEDSIQKDFISITDTDIPSNFTADSGSSIDNLRQGLNNLVTTLAIMINTLHSSGVGLDDSTGLDFFVPFDESVPLSIGNIQVNSSLNNTNKIAASASGEAGDNTIALEICDLSGQEIFQYDGLLMDYEDFYQSLVSWVGTTSSNAEGLYTNQSKLLQQVENQRQAISSVSLEEELANTITYQNAYSACARVLSTIDSLLEYMMNELG